MKGNNVGFTLIELLVVVLIIGILAAIALPQYTKAVERSRMSEAVQHLGDVATAQSIYYMTNNSFAADWSSLNRDGDIVIPLPSNSWTGEGAGYDYDIASSDGSVSLTLTRSGGMYKDSGLTITVHVNGQIDKTCAAGSNADFCTLASSAGYTSAS